MIMAAANDEDDDFVGGIIEHTQRLARERECVWFVDNKFLTCQEVMTFFLKMSIVQLYRKLNFNEIKNV